MTRPAVTPEQAREARRRRARLRAVPLVEAVRAFLAEGLPMTHTADYGLACAFCGIGVSGLAVDGHAAGCRWVLLRDRVAEER